jgi:hypothetical protein
MQEPRRRSHASEDYQALSEQRKVVVGVGDEEYSTFLVLDLGLDVVDGVAALDLERDRLPRQRLDEDLHLAVMPSPECGWRTGLVVVVVVVVVVRTAPRSPRPYIGGA